MPHSPVPDSSATTHLNVVLYRSVQDGLDILHTEYSKDRTLVYLEYLNEGAANVIFRYSEVKTSSAPPFVWPPQDAFTRVLRVRKSSVPSATSEETYAFQHDTIAPLFAGKTQIQPLGCTLIQLDEKVFHSLNTHLTELEAYGKRPARRCGEFLDLEDQNGLLMEDLSAIPPQMFHFELKPKWLSQSPSAPPQACLCRSCALLARRNLATHSVPTHPGRVCPLALLSGDRDYVEEQVACMLRKIESKWGDHGIENVRTKMIDFFLPTGSGHELMLHLRSLQEKLDPHGVRQLCELKSTQEANGESVDEKPFNDLSLAMTLRDCSLMMCVPNDEEHPIRAVITDCDVKKWRGPEGKLENWLRAENQLIEEKFYERSQDDPWNEQTVHKCFLLRTPAQ